MYRASDVFILSSLGESFGRVLWRRAPTGLLCLAHDYEITRFVLGSSRRLADLSKAGALAELINKTRGSWHDLGGGAQASHRFAYDSFSWDRLRPRYVELLSAAANSTVSSTERSAIRPETDSRGQRASAAYLSASSARSGHHRARRSRNGTTAYPLPWNLCSSGAGPPRGVGGPLSLVQAKDRRPKVENRYPQVAMPEHAQSVATAHAHRSFRRWYSGRSRGKIDLTLRRGLVCASNAAIETAPDAYIGPRSLSTSPSVIGSRNVP